MARQLHRNGKRLFRLKQELQAYRFYQTLIAACDQEVAGNSPHSICGSCYT